MSACHVKRENWKRAQETAEKALARNPKNYKAMFRRGKALGEQGFFERAEKILEELIKESPAGKLALWRSCRHTVVSSVVVSDPFFRLCDSDAPAATAELKRLRVIDKEKEKVHNQKLRGMCVHQLGLTTDHNCGVSTGWLNRGGLETSAADSEAVEEVASPGTKESQSTGTT
jgi:tetratricopeptide (TPR) repeat protein